MTVLSISEPEIGQPDSTQDPKIISAFTAIESVVNGNLDSGNFAGAYKDGAANVQCLRSLGTSADQAAPGNLVIVRAWTKASLQPNWFGRPTGGQEPGYRLSTDSTMGELKGELRNQDGAQGKGECMFVVAAEIHPAHTVRVPATWWNGSANGVGIVEIRANGEVVLEEGSAFGRLTLDGIRYPLT